MGFLFAPMALISLLLGAIIVEGDIISSDYHELSNVDGKYRSSDNTQQTQYIEPMLA